MAKDPGTSEQIVEMAKKWNQTATEGVDQGQPISIDQTITEYLIQAPATPTEEAPPITETSPQAARPAAELPPQEPGPGPKYQAGQVVEIDGERYTIADAAKYKRWENKKVAKEKLETLLRKGVIAEAPTEQVAPEEKPPANASTLEGAPAPITPAPQLQAAPPRVETVTAPPPETTKPAPITPTPQLAAPVQPVAGTKTPQEHFKEGFLPEIPKSNPMKMFKAADTHATTTTGEISNGHWMLKNAEVICIFKRSSRCIFKGALCDQDCDVANWEGNQRSHENLQDECLEGEKRKLAFPRKVVSLLLQFL